MYFPFSAGGTPTTIEVNLFATPVPNSIIHHYDVVISPSEKTLPARMTIDFTRRLQFDVAPQIFTPRCVYDGRKNIFCIHRSSSTPVRKSLTSPSLMRRLKDKIK
ncbi:hypothetical protein B0H14DRAFT_766633 [Mycena olivaceomarginata]|nr:hypothetical protein B0H14DRAFT_766633 [Mycena olivaceomarginata]